jgi:hypothetical protein
MIGLDHGIDPRDIGETGRVALVLEDAAAGQSERLNVIEP